MYNEDIERDDVVRQLVFEPETVETVQVASDEIDVDNLKIRIPNDSAFFSAGKTVPKSKDSHAELIRICTKATNPFEVENPEEVILGNEECSFKTP